MIKKIKSLFEKRSGVVSTGNLTETDDFWYGIVGHDASAGVPVSKATAMRQWAVYACVSIIAETLAQLPLKLKRPDNKGGTEDAFDHPLFHLCKDQPNPQMTSFNWRESMQANVLTSGGGYSVIDRGRYDVRAIYPADPDTVTPRLARDADIKALRLSRGDRIVYDIETDKGRKTFKASDVLHIVGFGFNGITGESVITNYAKESIGNAIALDAFQGKGMKNGMFPSGTLEHPDTLGDQKESFLSALEGRYSGVGNARRPMILENGMKFSKADVSFVDKQFIEQMKLTANQICGIFHVPPHKIQIFEKNTNYNNTEQGNKSFLDGTMQQWVVRWEQALNWKLLTPGERKLGYFFKFNFDALLRPDAKTRSEISWREWQMGTPLNEIRKRNDQNPLEGGEKSFVPANVIPIELAGQSIVPNKQMNQDELLEDDADGVRRLERNAVERVIKRDKNGRCEDFNAAIDAAYRRVFSRISGQTRFILGHMYEKEEADAITEEMRGEAEARKQLILESRENNYVGIEDIWS